MKTSVFLPESANHPTLGKEAIKSETGVDAGEFPIFFQKSFVLSENSF